MFKHRYFFILIVFVLIISCRDLFSENYPLKIPLIVREDAGISRKNSPVCSGIPLPAGLIKSINEILITDANGKAVEAQFRVLSSWPDKTIRWVLCDFQTDVEASAIRGYYLVSKEKKSVETQSIASLRWVEETPDSIKVSTGAMDFCVSKIRGNLIDWIKTGSNAVIKNDKGFCVINTNNENYSSINDKPDKVSIEESGPLRIVVKIDGTIKSKTSNAASDPMPLEYTARIHAYKNQNYLKLHLTLKNHDSQTTSHNFKEFNLSTINDGIKISGKPYVFKGGKYKTFEKFISFGSEKLPDNYLLMATAPNTWYRDTLAVPGCFMGVLDEDGKGPGVTTAHTWADENTPYNSLNYYVRYKNHPRPFLETARADGLSSMDAGIYHSEKVREKDKTKRGYFHVYHPNYAQDHFVFSHSGITGYLLYYCLTGDMYALECSKEFCEGVRNVWDMGLEYRNGCYTETRVWACSLRAVAEMYDISGDDKYRQLAQTMIKELLANMEERGYMQGFVEDILTTLYPWQFSPLCDAVARYCFFSRRAGKQDRLAERGLERMLDFVKDNCCTKNGEVGYGWELGGQGAAMGQQELLSVDGFAYGYIALGKKEYLDMAEKTYKCSGGKATGNKLFETRQGHVYFALQQGFFDLKKIYQDTQLPEQVKNLKTAWLSESEAGLRWDQAKDNWGVVKYKIYRSSDTTCPVNDKNLVTESPYEEYIDKNISPKQIYYYRISAVDVNNQSGPASDVLKIEIPADESPRVYTPPPFKTGKPFSIRINCGGPEYVDKAGNKWLADIVSDTYWREGDYHQLIDQIQPKNTARGKGGRIISTKEDIKLTDDDPLYQTAITTNKECGRVMYKFKVPNGTYNVSLLFGCILPASNLVSGRVFDVYINAEKKATIELEKIGAFTASLKKIEDIFVFDGELSIELRSMKGALEISAIVIESIAGSGLAPAQSSGQEQKHPSWHKAVNCGGPSYTDEKGIKWEADQKFDNKWGWIDGSNSFATEISKGASSAEIFKTERMACKKITYEAPKGYTRQFIGEDIYFEPTDKLSYEFNIPNGKYKIKLYFAESMRKDIFERSIPVIPETGKFHVLIQGRRIISDIDIYSKVGLDQPLIKEINNVSVTGEKLNVTLLSAITSIRGPKIRGIMIETE